MAGCSSLAPATSRPRSRPARSARTTTRRRRRCRRPFVGVEPARFTAQATDVADSGRCSATRRWTSWWTDALRANHDLRIAVSRLDEARALRGAARLDLAPAITASGGYTEQLLSSSQAGGDRRRRAT